MSFDIVAVFNRCAVIEFDTKTPFSLGEGAVREIVVEGLVNGVEGRHVLVSNRNVVCIHGLQPGTSYEVSCDGCTHLVTTREESVLLNVRSFGAVGDGVCDDTAALQAAVAACPADGTVYVPAGTYLVHPVFLKSSMTLLIEEGAVLLGDTERSHYPILPGMVRETGEKSEYNLGTWEGNPLDCFASLLTAIDCHDVDVIGGGVVNGNADHADWWENPKVKRTAWRPNMMFFNRCENMRVCGLTVKNSPCWNIHPYYSEHLAFLCLNIENPYNSPNTDGFDPESCQDVLLLGTRISVGDDCVAIKSGKYYMSRYHYQPSDQIEIRNCLLEKGHGSVTIGSEIAGGVSNVHVTKCVFRETDRGLRIKTRRGRGDRSVLTGLDFENVLMDGVRMPVTVNMFYFCDPDGHSDYVQNQEPAPVDELTPRIGTIYIHDVECRNVTTSLVCAFGLPEVPIEENRLARVKASFTECCPGNGKGRVPVVPIMMDHFPAMTGRSIYAHNVSKLVLQDVEITGADDTAPECIGVETEEFAEVKYL